MYYPKEYIMGAKKTQVAKEAVKAKAANKRPVGAAKKLPVKNTKVTTKKLAPKIIKRNDINHVINALKKLGSPEKSKHLQKFFKTGAGQYAEGDIFFGISVPLIRKTACTHQYIEIKQLEKLLEHKVHEVRCCALLIMIFKADGAPEQMYNLYLKKISFINNWDLVDLTAPIIIGRFLLDKSCSELYKLAQSKNLWARRIAIVSTFAFIKQGKHKHTFKLAEILMNDKHDLLHKAVGWMLREVGKRCSESILEDFLEKYATTMPRTTLRYSIERLPREKREKFMLMKARNHLR